MVALALASTRAQADPALSAELGGIGGVGYANLAGAYRDDDFVAMRFGVGIGRFVAADFAIAEDVDRVEPAVHLGARVRPWAGACWRARWSPYFRADVAAVGATHLGSNYDLTVGAGHWGHFSAGLPWLGWYGEVDGVARVGEVETWSLHVELGVSFATSAFWR
ncbi:MAG TPA: hypothetical protein VGF94_06035 [Kofleriaceae bacterium]